MNFPGSETYWDQRYCNGGNSGAGSYNHLAEFKAEIINEFIVENNVESVIEFGCGDGNQLKYANYPSYIGFDVSPTAVNLCNHMFADDTNKSFATLDKYEEQKADLVLSLDVIFHLVERYIYNDYMRRLFLASKKYVIIYASNFEQQQTYHMRHRKFTNWVESNFPQFKLIKHVPNKYPYNPEKESEGSFSSFYIYQMEGI